MLIFITLRYFKGFNKWKDTRIKDINKEVQGIMKTKTMSVSSKRKSVKF
jgi:RAB protein geranylgeranyltransferase component A